MGIVDHFSSGRFLFALAKAYAQAPALPCLTSISSRKFLLQTLPVYGIHFYGNRTTMKVRGIAKIDMRSALPGEHHEIAAYFRNDRCLHAAGGSVALLYGSCIAVPGGRAILAVMTY
jgi:hypothetical protein